MYRTRNIPNTRVEVADVLRGIAVAGIILIHACEHFNLYWSGLGFDRAVVEWLEQPVATVAWWLFAGKMYTVFALLFGFSFFVQSDNQAQRGAGFTGRFSWRMALLFLIGLVNTALYNGDVLVLYSILGLLMPWLGKLPSRWLWLLFGLLILQPAELIRAAAGCTAGLDDSRWSEEAMPVFTQGGLWDSLLVSLRCGQPITLIWYFNNGRITQTLAMFILGMLLGRRRLFYNEGGNLRIWSGILAGSLLLAAVLSVPAGGEGTPLRTASANWYNFAHTMAVVSGVVLAWYRSAGFRHAAGHMAYIGRMSLTNYLLQSLLGGFLFYNWGLGLFREIGLTYALAVGIGMVLLQYGFSRLWLRRFTHGPVEWIWKKLTWLPAPFRKAPKAA